MDRMPGVGLSSRRVPLGAPVRSRAGAAGHTDWRPRYESALELASRRAADAHDGREMIACGFTANVDRVIDLTPDLVAALVEGQRLDVNRPPAKIVASVSDLLTTVVHHVADGTGTDVPVGNPAVQAWLLDRVAGRDQVGGTGAQAANTLARLGFRTLLHVPSMSPLQARVLDASGRILVPGDGVPRSVADAVDSAAPTMWHVALEYPAGLSFRAHGRPVVAPHPNRVIVSYDPVNAAFSVAPDFVGAVANPGNGVRRLLLSGFSQLIAATARDHSLAETTTALGRWRASRSDLVAHLELGAAPEEGLLISVMETLGPRVDSVGLNSDEMGDLLSAWGMRTDLTAGNLPPVLHELRRRIPVARLGLHSLEFCLTSTIRDPEVERDALLFASLVASTRARIGTFPTFADLAETLAASSPHRGGLAILRSLGLKEGIGRDGVAWLVCVPTLTVERPTAAVGLGDSFTGGLLAML